MENECATCKWDNTGTNRRVPNAALCLSRMQNIPGFWDAPTCPGYERRNEE